MTNSAVAFDTENNGWRIDAPPHLVIKLKRIFPKIPKTQFGQVFLTDTEETARDLEWFLERHPLPIHKRDFARLVDRAAQHKERQSIVESMLARKMPPPEFDLDLPPREYQRLAAGLCLKAGGLLLADDLGLGKTISAICMLADRRTLPALVVTMTHLPRQWEAEIKRFAPKLRTHILKKGNPYDLTIKPRSRRAAAQLEIAGAPVDILPDVIITNYHKLSGWASTLAPLIEGRLVIFDEVQELRHPDSQRYSAAMWLAQHAAFRCGLSATPIHNLGSEYFNVLDVLFPGQLGTKGELIQEWCKDGESKSLADPAAFGSYLRSSGLMLRRTRSDVGREMPKLTKVVQIVESNAEALNSVSEACAELARVILSRGPGVERGAQMNAAGQLDMKLRMATGVAKAPFVADFVRMLVEGGEKVVLFGWHRSVYDIWLDKLKDLQPVMYTGTESPAQKAKSKEAFVSGDAKILIMSLRAGAGLDGLQHACRTVVHGELDWSPAVMEQDNGRVDRDGQKDPVISYYCISEEGSDPILVDILGLKRQQSDGVRDVQVDLVERLEVDGDRIKRLAEAYLKNRGIALPAPASAEEGAAA